MHFVIVYEIRPDKRDAAIERLLKTGGGPPEGATMLQRWHDPARQWGITVAQTDDPLALPTWCLQWNDVRELDIHQVVNDEQVGPLLAEMFAK